MTEPSKSVALLEAARSGEERAEQALLPLVYDELHAIAEQFMRREPRDHTLQPTALVNEAYLRLVGGAAVDWRNELHFRAVASNVMRRVLVDHARARNRQKRGKGQRLATLETSMIGTPHPIDVLEFEDVLAALEREDERAARVCTMRVLGGLTIERVAEWLDVSTATVERDWRFARAWLHRRLIGGDDDERVAIPEA